jgi:hypothetical protein
MRKTINITLDWEYQKEKLKEKYTGLTDKDLYFEQGQIELMITKLQDKLGKTRHQIYTIISGL